ncbi:MAG: gliding motility-associated C-terminal domain-containing protein [Flavobacterium sp.]|nr:gliding motility-associated C-terminal domain-containing protein [Flavobacterium sp.]
MRFSSSKRRIKLSFTVILVVQFLFANKILAQTASFTAPDTVCVNTPVAFTNTSVGATSSFWNFCVANPNQSPNGVNMGNIGGNFSRPVYVDYVFENGNYYGFLTNNSPEKLTRLDFGNSLLNTPVATNLGNVGGIIPTNAEGLQVVKNQGKWYVIIVGGDPITGSGSDIVRIDLGTNIANNSPSGVNWGNIGNLSYPHDLYVFDDGNSNWYGLTLNYSNNTITRFNFTQSFTNTPTAVNLGNLGNMNGPVGLHAVKDNNNWYAFVTNALSSTLTRIDFGASLLSTPTAVNLGNPSGLFNYCWDISILKLCGITSAFVINARGNYEITKLDFNGGITSIPTSTNLGNIGNLSFPHGLSKIFRVGSDLYSFIPNVDNNTLTRLQFMGCTSSSTPNSNLYNPPSVTYNSPGTYNINLTIDDGLATQSTYCKQVVVLPKTTVDFSFVQDVCNPLTVQFKNESSSGVPYSWDFGNGSFSTLPNPIVNFSSYNNYSVKLKTGGCADSITKQLAVNLNLDSVIINRDTVLCRNSSLQLNALSGLSYCWAPTMGLSNSKIANPVASPNVTTTYFLNSEIVTNNLVVNGNFTQGNTGFTSSYNYASVNVTEGQYFVGSNPNAWNSGTVACKDYTNGSGNMLLVNGAPVADVSIWQQTITVKPNTNYAFSAWLQAIYPINPAQLQFSINGKTIGNLFSAVLPTCNWQQFYTTWNSGNITSATISIVNKNTIVLGNDFALDDISFAELSIKRDSVTITVADPPIVNASKDTSICEGKSIQLSASGTTFYNWNQSAVLSDSTIANPTASPITTTNFIVKGYNVKECFSLDTVKVVVLPRPTLSLVKNLGFCKGDSVILNAMSDATSFQWLPSANLSSNLVYNPTAKPSDTTKYIVNLTGSNGCLRTDSVTINVWPLPTVKTVADTFLCLGKSVTLNTVTDAFAIAWLPSTGLSNAGNISPIASPLNTTQYIVKASSNNGCVSKDTVAITVLSVPVISKSADALICLGTSKTLFASAASALVYNWLPATGLNNANIAHPIASPSVTTNYYVVVTDTNGCSQIDSVLVTVMPYPNFKLSPNNAAICLNDSVLVSASGANYYQWLPTTNVAQPSSAVTYIKPSVTSIYRVTFTDTLCAVTDTLSVSFKVNPLPSVVLSKSGDANCIIGNVKLSATGAAKYRWFPTETLTNATSANPIASPATTTFYHVKAFSSDGCITQDSIEVKVIKGLKDEGYLVPTAFTPNNDGINDCFGVKYWGYVTDFRLAVYNRFGEILYASNNINGCWDGKIKGITQPSGTYVYEIAAKTICGEVYRKGTMVLIR